MNGKIFNSQGIHVGVVVGGEVFGLKGQKLYDLKGSNIYKLNGDLVGHLSDVVPPDPKSKPPTAKVVADCKFLKEEDERLGCFNRFLVKPARPTAVPKGAPKVQPSK